MGAIFDRYVSAIRRQQSIERWTYRNDGTRAFSTKVKIDQSAQGRSITFIKYYFDRRGRLIVSQETELAESSDHKLIRRTYEWNEAGDTTQCTTETLYLPRAVPQVAPLFDTPDMALIRLLGRYGLAVSDFEPRSEPQIESEPLRARRSVETQQGESVSPYLLRLTAPVGPNVVSVPAGALRLPPPGKK